MHPRTDDPAAALRRPLWWAALATLLVNDHLLKGAGLLPGWITGKLSDVAGMIVAPALAASLIPLRHKGLRVLSFLSVAALFAAVKVSPEARDALVAAAASLGMRWRIVVDPTDTFALAALPLAWSLTTPREGASHRPAAQRDGAGIRRVHGHQPPRAGAGHRDLAGRGLRGQHPPAPGEPRAALLHRALRLRRGEDLPRHALHPRALRRRAPARGPRRRRDLPPGPRRGEPGPRPQRAAREPPRDAGRLRRRAGHRRGARRDRGGLAAHPAARHHRRPRHRRRRGAAAHPHRRGRGGAPAREHRRREHAAPRDQRAPLRAARRGLRVVRAHPRGDGHPARGRRDPGRVPRAHLRRRRPLDPLRAPRRAALRARRPPPGARHPHGPGPRRAPRGRPRAPRGVARRAHRAPSSPRPTSPPA